MTKLAFTFVVSVLVASFVVSANAASPCKPIADACKKLGFYVGGNTVGKGLVDNCIMPVTMHKKTLANTSFSDAMLKECHDEVINKMK